MKEAAGEANLTVIAILLIGVIAAIATPLIKSIMKNTARSSCCQSYGYIWEDGICHSSQNKNPLNVEVSDSGECVKVGS